MKVLLNRLLALFPYALLTLLVGVVIVFIRQNRLTYEQFLGLVEVLVWPTIVLLALLFFRKVFTYLFFSMESFNFFGAKGRLKNVQEMIVEKAKELYEAEKREREVLEQKARLEELEERRDRDKISKTELLKLTRELVDDYRELSDKYVNLLQDSTYLTDEMADVIDAAKELSAEIAAKKERET